MKRTQKCPKCGSSDVIVDAKAIDRGDGNTRHELSLATYGKPDAIFFKDEHKTAVSAWVCAACGYVEFYADSLRAIRVLASTDRPPG